MSEVRRKLNIEIIRAEFEACGFVLVSDIFLRSNAPLEYICPAGHLGTIIYNPDREAVERNRWSHRLFARYLSQILHKDCRRMSRLETEALLGYTQDQLIDHFVNHPGWLEATGARDWVPNTIRGWHIDHVLPIVAFTKHRICDPAIVHGLNNLQPLSAQANWAKVIHMIR